MAMAPEAPASFMQAIVPASSVKANAGVKVFSVIIGVDLITKQPLVAEGV